MSRIDRKYWLPANQLIPLLIELLPCYNILEINDIRLMKYQTTYFDTIENQMYLKHHNQSLPRFKVRKRRYESTGSDFLEIKLKTNKKITLKDRIPASFDNLTFTEPETRFLSSHSFIDKENFIPVLNNRFYRITLVHNENIERITLDISPEFWNKTDSVKLKNLAIFELKRSQSLRKSTVISVLRKLNIRNRGLSKYCTGRALLETSIKKNLFKPRIRYLTDKLVISNAETD